jgi:hypothetical protein
MWLGVLGAADTPRRRPVEELLVRMGIPDHVGRLLSATPSLRLSWFLAVIFALGFAVLAAHAGGNCLSRPGGECSGLLLFLVLVPLIPLAGVAAAYGPGVDPTYEIGLAAPMRSHRLLLIRALAVLATSTILAGGAALALPGLDWSSAAWLLPSLALSAATLALSTFWRPHWAAASVALTWMVLVTASELASVRELVVFRAAGQGAFLLLAAVSGVVLALRRQALDFRRTA